MLPLPCPFPSCLPSSRIIVAHGCFSLSAAGLVPGPSMLPSPCTLLPLACFLRGLLSLTAATLSDPGEPRDWSISHLPSSPLLACFLRRLLMVMAAPALDPGEPGARSIFCSFALLLPLLSLPTQPGLFFRPSIATVLTLSSLICFCTPASLKPGLHPYPPPPDTFNHPRMERPLG